MARSAWTRGEEALRRGVQCRMRCCPRSFLHTRPRLCGSPLGVTRSRPPPPHLSGRGKSDSNAGPMPHDRPTVEPRWLYTDWAALSEHLHFLPFLFLCSHREEKLGSAIVISIAKLSLCSKSFCRKEWNWWEEDQALTGFGSQGELQALCVGSRGPGRVDHEGQPWRDLSWQQEVSDLERRCVRACSVAQSCLTLCTPMDCSPPGSSVHGILQARILEWVAICSSRGSSSPRDETHISSLLHWQVGSLPLAPPRELN